MLCMTDYARDHDGLGTLSNAADLARSAGKKSGDIIRCDSFSHEACGHQFTFWMQRTGYLAARCWRAGENIAWGTGGQASVRSIFVAWLHSPEHRANLLGRYSSIGIGLRIGNLDGTMAPTSGPRTSAPTAAPPRAANTAPRTCRSPASASASPSAPAERSRLGVQAEGGVGLPGGEGAGAEGGARVEGGLDEGLGAEVGTADEAGRERVAGDEELPGDVDRCRLAVAVEHVDAGVGDRPTGRRRVVGLDPPEDAGAGTRRRSVGAPEDAAAGPGRFGDRVRQNLAEAEPAERARRFQAGLDERLPDGRRGGDEGRTLGFDRRASVAPSVSDPAGAATILAPAIKGNQRAIAGER